MKVLHIAETIKGGVGTVLDDLVFYQYNSDKNINVLCLIPDEHCNVLEKNKISKVETFQRNGRSIKSLFNLYRKSKSLIEKEKPDIIHCHSTFAGFIIRFFFNRGKYNFKTVYSPHAFSFVMKKNKLSKVIFSFVERYLSKKTDKIICVSKYEYGEAVKNNIPPSLLTVIHNGVDPEKNGKFKVLGSGRRINILFVGRFDYQKGVDTLFEAIKLLSEEDKLKYNFNIVGESVEGEFNKNLISNEIERYVKFHGWLSKKDIAYQYALADCIVIPSRWEGFAMVPLEAMGHGTPVIASNIPPFLELIENGKYGIIFECDNPISLHNALKEIDLKRLTSIREEAYRNLIDTYTSVKMNVSTINIYEVIMGE